MTYWISMPGVTLSLEAKDGYIVDASALAEWAIGQAAVTALEYFRQLGAIIDWVRHEG